MTEQEFIVQQLREYADKIEKGDPVYKARITALFHTGFEYGIDIELRR